MRIQMTAAMTCKHYPVGQAVTDFQPGDFIVVETNGFAAKTIRFGQWLRYHGKRKIYAKYNHAALIVDVDGGLIEAKPTNVSRGHLSDYVNDNVYVVHTNFNEQSREQAIAAAESYLNDGYGWFTILSIMVELITGIKIQLSYNRSIICSALVSMSLWAGGIIFNSNPLQMMPADLGAAFKITPKE